MSIPHTATLVQIFKLTRIFSSGRPNRVFQGSAEPPVKGSVRTLPKRVGTTENIPKKEKITQLYIFFSKLN